MPYNRGIVSEPLTKEEKQLNKLVESYVAFIDKKGIVEEWTDAAILRMRDRFRLAARKTRGCWTFDFYEALQILNKESIKRDLKAAT